MTGGQLPIDGANIVEPLLRWFRKTKRDLPWRRTYQPYHIWISEILLQQTQMDRGVAYFLRWIKRFPDVTAVAEAKEQEILKYWEGLGYYARARNLHRAAKIMVAESGGEVVCDYDRLIRLPGIGPYTAAAIASVAGNHDIATIDANVNRVYARLFDIGESLKERKGRDRVTAIANTLLPQGRARAYNQAIMDFGGLVCTARSPHCGECPLCKTCLALKADTVSKRPLVSKPQQITVLHRVAGYIQHQGKIFIQQRRSDDLWGGLWEFPGGEAIGTAVEQNLEQIILQSTGLCVEVEELLTTVVHQYTRYKNILSCYYCRLQDGDINAQLEGAVDYRWLAPEDFNQFAFPAGPRKILEYLRLN
jgi:A/G-specific adenine glycosylase